MYPQEPIGEGFGNTHPSMFREHGRQRISGSRDQEACEEAGLLRSGGLNDPAQMEEIIASGKADVVYMGRALLADPYLPRKVMEGRDDEIVHCLRCFTCMAERANTFTRRCTVNPVIGREIEGDEIQPAPVKKKVVVVGGGPGGLMAAKTAAKRGHQVILMEKESELGGILKSESAIPFKYRDVSADRYLRAGCHKVRRRDPPELRSHEGAGRGGASGRTDHCGRLPAFPLIVPIPGLTGPNVVVVNNYYKDGGRSRATRLLYWAAGWPAVNVPCTLHRKARR